LKRVSEDLWQAGGEFELYPDGRGRRGAGEDALEQLGNSDRLAFRGNDAAKIQQVVDDPTGGIDLLLDHEMVFLDLFIRIRLDEFEVIDGINSLIVGSLIGR